MCHKNLLAVLCEAELRHVVFQSFVCSIHVILDEESCDYNTAFWGLSDSLCCVWLKRANGLKKRKIKNKNNHAAYFMFSLKIICTGEINSLSRSVP